MSPARLKWVKCADKIFSEKRLLFQIERQCGSSVEDIQTGNKCKFSFLHFRSKSKLKSFFAHDDVMSVTIRETLEFVYVNNVNGALCGENTANINSTLQYALSNLNISNGTLELEEIFIFMENIFSSGKILSDQQISSLRVPLSLSFKLSKL